MELNLFVVCVYTAVDTVDCLPAGLLVSANPLIKDKRWLPNHSLPGNIHILTAAAAPYRPYASLYFYCHLTYFREPAYVCIAIINYNLV